MTDEEIKAGINAVQKLYINNPKVDEINKYFRRLNVFRILGIETMEIKHSNMLAWLMNPNENHALGDKFFKRLMLEIIKANGESIECGGSKPLTYSDILCNTFSDLIVRREWFNIDLLAISKSNKLIVLIENKIYAAESKDENGKSQLKKYKETIEKEFPPDRYKGYKTVFVFLTLDGRTPMDNDSLDDEKALTDSDSLDVYIPLSYQAVYDSAKGVKEAYCNEINPNTIDFIKQYLEVLEGLLLNDDELAKLCKTVYKENREAIQLILKYKDSALPDKEQMETFHKETDTFRDSIELGKRAIAKGALKYYSFIPVEWSNSVPAKNLYTQDKWLVFFWFSFADLDSEGDIFLGLYVGKFSEADKRKAFIDEIGKQIEKHNKAEEVKATDKEKNIYASLRRNSTANTALYTIRKHIDDSIDLDDDVQRTNGIVDTMIKMYKDPTMQDYKKCVDKALKKCPIADVE